MADKTLRIIFNGISTLTPPPPRNGEKTPNKAFVMMAANGGGQGRHTNQWGTTIPQHFPFVLVAASAPIDPFHPPPHEIVSARENGEHFVYFLENARVVIQPAPKRGTHIDYFTDPEEHPLGERPGSDDVAPAADIRWLADIRDILSKPAPLKKTANPAGPYVGEEVAAVVDLEGGQLKANFPCATVSPKTFRDPKTGRIVPGLRRVLADEFIIDIPYSEDVNQITLEFQPLREGTAMSAPAGPLVLHWRSGETLLEVRMGNDTKEEVRRLETPDRCDPVRQSGPVLKARDDDFDLHYNFLALPDDVGRPLPENDIHQCRFDGCKPGTT